MSNPFSGVSKANVFESGSYLPYAKGRYVATVSRVLLKDSRKSGQLFTIELEIEESNRPEVQPGETKTVQWKMSNTDSTPGNIKLFVLAAKGIKTSEQERVNKALKTLDQDCQDACEKNSLEGARVIVTTEPVMTRAGAQFTKHVFAPAA